MNCSNSIGTAGSPYDLLFTAASLIPVSHYILGLLFVCSVFVYNFFEIHILQDLLTGFRGDPVSLTFSSCSQVYQEVVSKCRILHGRYLPTPWLSSPHFVTFFLSFFGRPPLFSYRRQLFHMPDGGTVALDWLMSSDVLDASLQMKDGSSKDDTTPIVIVIPGLTSDSASAYVKHFAFNMAKGGWNVVVSNHRGLGGISITSDCFYNGGWTEDLRKVIDHLHSQYPEVPLFVLGTSLGANILVKYLGEDGINTPVSGAAAICCPWDLLIGDRFINRRLVQKFYDQAMMIGLKAYARLHQPIISRLADWDGIARARSIREFDNFATRVLGKYETVDTFYRRCSSSHFVGNVMVPLLCISALDDPVCTREAIPWDECRANKNIVLATTQHGGHLAHFEGLNAKSLWWVRAVHEFFNVLHSSSLIHRKNGIQIPQLVSHQEIDQGPYVNVMEDGMLAATGNEQTVSAETATGNEQIISAEVVNNQPVVRSEMDKTMISEMHKSDHMTGERTTFKGEALQPLGQDIDSIIIPAKRCINQLSRQSRKSIWLLAYIAIVSTWPLVGPAFTLFFQKKFGNFLPTALRRR